MYVTTTRVTPDLRSQDNSVICPKCNKRGFLFKHANKPHVQIPRRDRIHTILEALDYAAKSYYRVYERNLIEERSVPGNSKMMPESEEYLRVIWFSPHSRSSLGDFAYDINQKAKERKPSVKNRKNVETPSSYNRSVLDKIIREQAVSQSGTFNGISILFLFFSISFAALKRYYEDLVFIREFFTKYKLLGNSEGFPSKEQEVLIARCLLFKPSLLAYVKDDRNNSSLQEWMTMLQDTINYGSSGASSRNMKPSNFCQDCKEKRNRVSIMGPNGVCTLCKSKRTIFLRPSAGQIRKVSERLVCYALEFEEGYSVFLRWSSILLGLMNANDGLGLSYYRTYFDNLKDQFIDNPYSFLKEPRYYIGHTRDESGKRPECGLGINDFEKIIITNKEYDKFIDDLAFDVVYIRNTSYMIPKVSRLREMLMKQNYPMKHAIKKIQTDLDYVLMTEYPHYPSTP